MNGFQMTGTPSGVAIPDAINEAVKMVQTFAMRRDLAPIGSEKRARAEVAFQRWTAELASLEQIERVVTIVHQARPESTSVRRAG